MCNRYWIRYSNAKGWSDLNQRADMMCRFAAAEQHRQHPVLLNCGDHDPSGLLISKTPPQGLDHARPRRRADVRRTAWDPATLIVDRFGLNRDFIDAHHLTWIDGLTTGSNQDLADPAHRDHDKAYIEEYIKAHGARKVEANALVVAAEAGRQLLLDTIHKYIAPDALDRYEARLREPREALRVETLRQLRHLAEGSR